MHNLHNDKVPRMHWVVIPNIYHDWPSSVGPAFNKLFLPVSLSVQHSGLPEASDSLGLWLSTLVARWGRFVIWCYFLIEGKEELWWAGSRPFQLSHWYQAVRGMNYGDWIQRRQEFFQMLLLGAGWEKLELMCNFCPLLGCVIKEEGYLESAGL